MSIDGYFAEHRRRIRFWRQMKGTYAFRSVRNHVDLAEELIDLAECMRKNEKVLVLPDVERCLKAVYSKMETLYGRSQKAD